MKKTLCMVAVIVLALITASTSFGYEALTGPSGVLRYNKANSYGGYTVFAPMLGCKTTYLIDMEGNLVHQWESEYPPGLFAMLLPNGNLLRGGSMKQAGDVSIGGAGGIVQEIDWDSKVVWEYKMNSETELQHHCFDRMPNGNTLILGWEAKSLDEVLAKGRDPKSFPASEFFRGKRHTKFWVDFVREVDKKGKTIWEWHVWDHVGTGPQQWDINFKLPDPVGGRGQGYSTVDWTHFNTCEYIPEHDMLLLNSRNFSEFYLIDHKTGEMVYRWGNPSAYGQGKRPTWYDNGDQKLFGSHNATWLGKNRVQVFDNGSERAEGNRSAAVEVDITTGEIVWEYESHMSNSFFSYRQGAAQRLPNGNVHITSTHGGHFIEVTPKGEIAWEYVSPIRLGKPVCYFSDENAMHNGMFNMVHRSYRYGADYPGLIDKDLSQKNPLTDCPKFYEIYNTME